MGAQGELLERSVWCPGVLLAAPVLLPVCLLYLVAVTCTSLSAASPLPSFGLQALAVPDEPSAHSWQREGNGVLRAEALAGSSPRGMCFSITVLKIKGIFL